MRMLDDNPTTDDVLGFGRIADILYSVIRDTQKAPFTIGVFGEWGCGKTSLMKMVEKRLRNDDVKTVWFNAWKYDGKEVIWNALIQEIFYSIQNDLELQPREDGEDLKNRIIKASEGIAKYAAKVATRFIPGGIIKEEDVDSIVDALSPLSAKDSQFKFINEFESNFDRLVKEYVGKEDWGQEKFLVVFIDDLDRCLPENAITVMEALKLYLDRANCIFVIGAESSIIEEGIRQRYKDNERLSAREYLEKIVQLPFIMPGIEAQNALSLLDPYEKTLSYRGDPVVRTLIVEGTECNPRRIKRFINAFWVLSEISGQLSPEEQQHLAKILLIQIRFPKLYYALEQDLNLIDILAGIASMGMNKRDNVIALSSKIVKELCDDMELMTFLDKTKEIPCKQEKIERWVLLTKGRMFGV